MKQLFVTPSRCTACRNCEVACSFVHTTNPATLALPRVHTYAISETQNTVNLCLQCDDAACRKVCPVEALNWNEKTGAIEVNLERCIRCLMCTIACPFGNIHFDLRLNEIMKCDLCRGDPACAKFCPTLALEYAEKPSPEPKPGETKSLPPLPWMLFAQKPASK
jgi:carbon-monoxide dehydrogenase iron sulfur subunit